MNLKLNKKTIDTAPFYQEIGKEVEVFTQAFNNKLPLLLKGPTGSGKSRFIEFMAHKLEKKLYTVSCHEETSAVDLLGRYIIKGNETLWQDGLLTKAAREGAIIYLDEFAEARPDTLVAIHALTDHRRMLFLERRNEEIKAPDDFMLVASYNPGYQRGLKELKPSTKQRFLALTLDYAPEGLEQEIILNETGIENGKAIQLVLLARKIRNLSELGLAESVSSRLLIDAAKLMHSGLGERLACETAIIEPLTDDEDTKKALKEIVSAIF